MDRLDNIHDDLQGTQQTATNQLNDLIDILFLVLDEQNLF